MDRRSRCELNEEPECRSTRVLLCSYRYMASDAAKLAIRASASAMLIRPVAGADCRPAAASLRRWSRTYFGSAVNCAYVRRHAASSFELCRHAVSNAASN